MQNYLTTVNGWLQENPNEVLTFLFTNPDNASLSGMWEPAFQASGILDLVYTPPQVPMAIGSVCFRTFTHTDAYICGKWPTLGELIDNGTRVIVFLDAGADTDRSVPFILPEFEMVGDVVASIGHPDLMHRSSPDLGDTVRLDRSHFPL